MDVLSGSNHGPGLDTDTVGARRRIRLYAFTNTSSDVITTDNCRAR
jgi:hypothetical protein